MGKIVHFLIILFSFFLGFGKFDPFNTGGLYFDVLTITVLFFVAIKANLLSQFKKYKFQLFLLLLIGLLLFFLGIIYGPTIQDVNPFNLKYFAAVAVFWFLSFSFENDKLRNYSILAFSISCGVLALLYYLDFFPNVSEIRNGRLNIFGENPNSISTRMALAFIILLYFNIENPLKLSILRFGTLIFTPFLFLFVIDTGSRGSFLIMLLGGMVLLLFSDIRRGLKISLVSLIVISSSYFFYLLYDTGLYQRFQQSDLSGGREEIWSDAISIFYDFPLGTGEGGYTTEMFQRFSYLSDAHNLFLYILISGGFISFILFILFMFGLLRKSLSAFRNKKSLNITLFIFMFFLASKTGGVITYLIMWYVFAIINSYVAPSLNNTK